MKTTKTILRFTNKLLQIVFYKNVEWNGGKLLIKSQKSKINLSHENKKVFDVSIWMSRKH